MFDDYEFKDTDSRIKVKFSQKRDEPMYPWEIASFLNKFNTVYYKFELLNSICSALIHGIKPEDIFIFDHSLPLYQRYSEMDLISEPQAAKLFYPIGLPTPLVPSVKVYEFNCLYRIFKDLNSLLKRKHVQPLRLSTLSFLYEELQSFGLNVAEQQLISRVLGQAEKSHEAALKRNEKKEKISQEDIDKALGRYWKYKGQIFSDVEAIEKLSGEQLVDLITTGGRESRRLTKVTLSFFEHFEKTTRPLVCARVGDNKFRVLGRSLINKLEQTGLELKEIKRNSPLAAFFEGGVAIYQAIQQERRAKEIHEVEMKLKHTELELAEAKLQAQKMENLGLELKVVEQLEDIVKKTDIIAVRQLPPSFVQLQLIKAYGIQHSNASNVLHNQGLTLDGESIKVVDVSA
ncbi:hypothetical protein [Pseudomonas multiresinivorans]|uniref:Uncharacterized protein n=1 Tax=Pseudomonas multiresinivorans TaxID=95301 RepID=A0A7Z3GPH6_9PSED|nr:hypothetical protein [Pseudomonas multiresinivorans]QJP07669.1 hypothetical protein G4G71_07125 [Pseudomonas multiresinivorans]